MTQPAEAEGPQFVLRVTGPDAIEVVLKVVREHGSPTVAQVVHEASKEADSSRVREAYWQLLTEHRLRRTPAGRVISAT